MFDVITARKRAEAALRESEERFWRALENIPDVVVIYDRDLRIQYINAATRRITGRPPSDSIGRRDEAIWPPEVYGAYLPTLREAFGSRTICSVETDLLMPEGSRALSITCVPVIDAEGEVREVLGITHDHTDRKRAEEAIRNYSDRQQSLSRDLLAVQERERRRIATELHDEIGQLLTGLKLTLEMGPRLPPDAIDASLDEAQSMVGERVVAGGGGSPSPADRRLRGRV